MDVRDLEQLSNVRLNSESRSKILHAIQTANPDLQIKQNRTVMKKVAYSIAGVCLVLSGTLAAGVASPAMAEKLQQVPVIGTVFNLLKDGWVVPGVEHAAKNGLTEKIVQSATDKGITLTIGNLYFDQKNLYFDLVQSFPKDEKQRPDLNPKYDKDSGQFRIDGPQMDLTINGKKYEYYENHIIGTIIGSSLYKVDGDRFAGVVQLGSNEFEGPSFPENATMDLHIRKIAGIQGDWHFTFQASSEKSDQATKTFYPKTSKTTSGTTLTVDQVTVRPSTTELYCTYSLPKNEDRPTIQVQIFDDQNHNLGYNTIENVGNQFVIEGDKKVYKLHANYQTPNQMPKSLRLQTSYLYIPNTFKPTIVKPIDGLNMTVELK